MNQVLDNSGHETKRRRIFSSPLLILLTFLVSSISVPALPQFLGDLDEDGRATVLDLVRLQNHLRRANVLDAIHAFFADVNEDGFVNEGDVTALGNVILGLSQLKEFPLARIRESSPANGESGVSVNRETIFRLTLPMGSNAMVNTSNLFAMFGGRKILSRVDVSSDRKTVTLFYLEPVPASARVRVTFNGGALTDFLGRPVDFDGDGFAGGVARVDFDTLSITPVFGTAVIGHVYASEPLPGTNSTNFVNLPLEGVFISVDGAEESLWTRTDSNGYFRLQPVPAGRFFVHVDGRSAVGSRWPSNVYYPVVGKAWEAAAGRTNNLAGGSGEIFLPLIQAGSLQPVSATNDTTITFAPSVLASNPWLAGVSITVPPNSLFSDGGTRGGMVGIAAVPPDRLPEPLPPGLEFPVVITVQTDGGLNFDQPVPACFPNLPDSSTGEPLPPGTKNYLYSFNHDKGVWEAVGPMTVSANGNFICTDEGVGIRQPGWHGSGPPPDGPPRCDPRFACCDNPPPIGPVSSSLTASALRQNSGAAGSCPPCEPDLKKYGECVDGAYEAAKARTLEIAGSTAVCMAGALALPPPADIAWIVICANDAATKLNSSRVTLNQQLKSCADQYLCQEGSGSIELNSVTARLQSSNPRAPLGNGENVSDLILEAVSVLANRPSGPSNEDFTQAVTLIAQANQIAGGDAASFLNTLASHAREDFRQRLLVGYQYQGNAPSYPILYVASFLNNGMRVLLRGRTGNYGNYELFVPRSAEALSVTLYDPRTLSIGGVLATRNASGVFEIPRVSLFLQSGTEQDSDSDNISNEAEAVLGTDPLSMDTDHDGIPDGIELVQVTDPLDGIPVITGVIAASDTPGNAIDVCAINDLAIVADSSEGVVIFNAADRKNLTRIAQVNTPGNAQRVACSGNLIAVADGTAGLAVIDITDPPAARIVYQLNLGATAQAVAVAGRTAYVGLNSGRIVAVDLVGGGIVQQAIIPGSVQDLGIRDEFLYVLTTDRLYTFSIQDGDLSQLNSTISPTFAAGNRRLFVGDDFAYAVQNKGANAFSFTDPAAPILVSAANTTQFGWKQFVPNGSGLALVADDPNFALDGPNDISLYSLQNPTNTQAFLTRFSTPGVAHAVSIYNGLAYVADGQSGLQVVNYLAYDAQGLPPTIQLKTSFARNTPTNGVAEEGKWVRLLAQVTDDVQVGVVEFYVNGQRVLTDGNFPFEGRFLMPLLIGGASNITVRARALDTGGNATWSDEILVTLLPDSTPPLLSRTFPAPTAILGGVDLMAAYFSEPINPETLNDSTFRLWNAGSDGLLYTGDDSIVTNGVLSYREELKGAFLSFPTNLAPGLYQAEVTPPIADRAGNAMTNSYSWFFWIVPGHDPDQDGVPDDVELVMGLDPQNPDSNGNGVWDGDEDRDSDGLANKWEVVFGYNPAAADSNGNGLRDDVEDFDGDGLLNRDEIIAGTNPGDPDTDRDGWNDETEVTYGSSPFNPTAFPQWYHVSRPIVRLLAPAVGNPEFPPNVTLAHPPVQVVLSGQGDSGWPLNVTVSRPPLTIVLPGSGGSSLSNNVIVARPPVSVRFNPE